MTPPEQEPPGANAQPDAGFQELLAKIDAETQQLISRLDQLFYIVLYGGVGIIALIIGGFAVSFALIIRQGGCADAEAGCANLVENRVAAPGLANDAAGTGNAGSQHPAGHRFSGTFGRHTRPIPNKQGRGINE